MNREEMLQKKMEYRLANKDKIKAYREANKEKTRDYDKSRRLQLPEELKSQKAAYRAANKDKIAAYNKSYASTNPREYDGEQDSLRQEKYRANNPEKVKARNMVNLAIRLGKVQQGCCEVCGSVKAEGHHEDYSKPLQVNWLCRRHHMDRHAALRLSGV